MNQPRLFTTVDTPSLDLRLTPESGIVSLGSCFADEIGQRLEAGGFAIEANPFGTLYNPASIAAALHRLVDDRELDATADLVEHEGLWHSWHHHGSFSRKTQQEVLDACNSRIHQAHRALRDAKLLMVTFGTAWVFELSPESGFRVDTPGGVVANCHKLPAATFCRRRLDVHEIVSQWQPLLLELHALGCHVVFTVSPIRHTADGAHGNQLSKSTLLLAVDQLVQTGAAAYFDSYEILMDELRDYRFYARDLCHPSDLAVDIMWERLQQTYMTDAVRQKVALNEKALRQSLHRPLHPKQ